MSGIYSSMAIIAFILAAAFLVVGGILFFALDIKNVYSELSGKAHKADLSSGPKRNTKNKRTSQKNTYTQFTRRRDVEDEPPTVMENGMEASGSLVGVYEPGIEWSGELTEMEEIMPDIWDEGEKTEILNL